MLLSKRWWISLVINNLLLYLRAYVTDAVSCGYVARVYTILLFIFFFEILVEQRVLLLKSFFFKFGRRTKKRSEFYMYTVVFR